MLSDSGWFEVVVEDLEAGSGNFAVKTGRVVESVSCSEAMDSMFDNRSIIKLSIH